tara:strand:- start:4664 stop:4864 length:201 start_codon:yes stop_codon:yes gene_type:complete
MGRTNNLWVLNLYYDLDKKNFIKSIELNTLKDLSYLLGCEIYDVSNFYHRITKPKGVFEYITITKF